MKADKVKRQCRVCDGADDGGAGRLPGELLNV